MKYSSPYRLGDAHGVGWFVTCLKCGAVVRALAQGVHDRFHEKVVVEDL